MPARARLARASASISRLWFDADRLLDLGRQHLEQAARAGADIEQTAGTERQVMAERPLDLAVGDVQCTEFIPALGIVAEEAGGGRLATLLDGIQPGAVGRDPGMLGVEPAHEFAHQGGILAAIGQAEAGELGLAETLQQACLDQQFQVPGDARLALPQHVHIVADGQVLASGQGQYPQPGVFGSGPQQGEEVLHGKNDISISLCIQGFVGATCGRENTRNKGSLRSEIPAPELL